MAKKLIPGSKIQNTYEGKTYTGWVVKDCKDGTYLCRFKDFSGHNGNQEERNIGNPDTNDYWFINSSWGWIKVISYHDANPGDYVRIKDRNYKIVSRTTDKNLVYIEWYKKACYRGDSAIDKIEPSVIKKGIKLVSLVDEIDAFFKADCAFGKKKTVKEKKKTLEVNNLTSLHVGQKVRYKEKYTGEIVFIEDDTVLCKLDHTFSGHTARTAWEYIGKQTESIFYWCSEDDLEVVENYAEKIEITTDGKKTTAVLYNNDGSVKRKASAKCSPDDKFDFEIGAQIAMKRLKLNEVPAEDLVEKPKYSIVKCVGYKQKNEFFFTVGKEYKIYENGEITNDNGHTYRCYKTKKDQLEFLSKWYIFEEVK